MSQESVHKIIHYIQKSLYEGKQPADDGRYAFSKKSLADGAKVSETTVNKYKLDLIIALEEYFDFYEWARYKNYKGEKLFKDVSYEKGTLYFRRNPITESPEMEYLWALPPLHDYYTHDYFDDEHRRVVSSSENKYDAVPGDKCKAKIGSQNDIQEVKLDAEQERIKSIKNNGGCHLQYFKEKNITYNMCLVAVELTGYALNYVPEKFRTEDIYKIACKKTGVMLELVPADLITETMCKEAVASSGEAIEFVPAKYKTKELYLMAAKKLPIVMQKMPIEYLTVEFCAEVIKHYGLEAIISIPKSHKNAKFYLPLVEIFPELIWHIPKAGRTAVICKTAIKEMGYESTAAAIKDKPELLSRLHTSLYDHEACVNFVKSSLFSKAVENNGNIQDNGMLYYDENEYSIVHILQWNDVIEYAVNKNGYLLEFVKKELLTHEICIQAVAAPGYGYAIDYVPDELKTEELCMLAFSKDPCNIKKFPEKFATYEMWLKAITKSGYLFEYLPKGYITKEICMAAIKTRGSVLKYIPPEIMDEEICIVALQNVDGLGYGLFRYIPENLRTYRVCQEAVKADAVCFEHIPKEYKTYELCLFVAQKNAYEVKDIPEEFYTEELCMAMIDDSMGAFVNIPPNCLTEKICLEAVKRGYRYKQPILKDVPDHLITQEMCDIVFAESPYSIQQIPERFVTKEMLIKVAKVAPHHLSKHLPEKYRAREFIDELIMYNPEAEQYLEKA